MARASRKDMKAKMREKLAKRTQESHTRREDSGSGMKNMFISEKMSDISTWWADVGDHLMDIIPYEAGAHDPRNDKGEPAYVLDVEVHRFVGPGDDMIVCPEQYGGPCPICEEGRKLNRMGKDWKTEVKPLKPSRRAVYNVIVRDNGEQEKKGVQIFEIAHWFMEKHLSKIAKDPRDGGFTVFADPYKDEGKTISFSRTGKGSDNTGYDGWMFLERKYDISDEEMDAAYCLDELIEIKSYDEIQAIFLGTHAEEPEAQPESKPEEHEEPDETDDNRTDEEPEETERERKKRERAERKAEKEAAETKQGDVLVCPGGGTIGEDIDELEHCDDCELYDECDEIADTV